ncbi:MAG: Membrane protein [Frankiales bacterium]|jgi:sortase A|nr:Membrane protein [Frankiales bacterium]
MEQGVQPSFVVPPVRPRPRRQLVAAALRRPGARRITSLFTVVLLLAGIGLFAYPVATDLYGKHRQSDLREAFRDPAVVQAYAERRVAVGDGLTRLRIPKLDVDVLVVEGTTTQALRAGAGHYEGSPLPGETGNLAIAGHRTTFNRPFNRLDELGEGDLVELETPFAVHVYRAVAPFAGHANPWVVAPDDFSVLDPEGDRSLLTLTTCHPKGSAEQRLIMRFELVGSEPLRTTA